MRPLSSLGIGLSLVFGCLLLALVAELYYLLWWKKRISNREMIEDEYISSSTSTGREFFYLFCWKKPSSLSSTALNPQNHLSSTSGRITDSTTTTHVESKDFVLEDVGAELMRLHNLSGPPRFLFTIKEETKEDLVEESEDGKSIRGSRSRSLSDILLSVVETPFLTPMSSPSFFTPPLTPVDSYYHHHGFNPLFESSSTTTDATTEVISITKSPPPKFKFLKDAEEKLYRRKLMEEEEEAKKRMKTLPKDETRDEDGSAYITIIVNKNQDQDLQHHHHHSSSSQVLPLSSSPSTYKKKLMFH